MARLRLLTLSLLALLMLLAPPPALAQQPLTVRLDPIDGSGVRGTATISARDDVATLMLAVSSLAPGSRHLVHLHTGTCAQPSASAGLRGTLVADTNGRATLTATRATMSATGAPVTLTLDLLADGAHVIDVHDPGTVACGAIPAAESLPGLPRTGTGGAPTHQRVDLLVAGSLIGLGLFGVAGGLVLRRRKEGSDQ
jgi:hypothetical protein